MLKNTFGSIYLMHVLRNTIAQQIKVFSPSWEAKMIICLYVRFCSYFFRPNHILSHIRITHLVLQIPNCSSSTLDPTCHSKYPGLKSFFLLRVLRAIAHEWFSETKDSSLSHVGRPTQRNCQFLNDPEMFVFFWAVSYTLLKLSISIRFLVHFPSSIEPNAEMALCFASRHKCYFVFCACPEFSGKYSY